MKRLARPTPATWLALGALGTYLAWALLVALRDDWFPIWDSALYLLTGRSLAVGEGYLYAGQPFLLRPPGFPWLLGQFWQEGGYDFASLNRLVMVLASAAVVAFYAALRRPMGPMKALGAALLAGTCPLFVESFPKVLSEFPFVACLFGGLGLLQASDERGRWWWACAVGGAVLLAAALYVRAAALVLLPALLLLGWRRDGGRRRWRALLAPLLVVLLMLPWWQFAGRAQAEVSRPSDQLLAYDYATCVLHTDVGDPSSPAVPLGKLLGRVSDIGGEVLSDLVSRNLFLGEGWLAVLGALVLLAGLVLRCRRQASLFEWWAVVYLGVVLVFPAYGPRLLMPLVPLVYLYLFEAVGSGAARIARGPGADKVARGACAALFVLLLAANLWALPGATTRDYASEVGERQARKTLNLTQVARWVREHTPEDAVLLCRRAPILALLAKREVYTYRIPRGRDLMRAYDVDYVVLDDRPPKGLRRLAERRSDASFDVPVGAGQPPVRVYHIAR